MKSVLAAELIFFLVLFFVFIHWEKMLRKILMRLSNLEKLQNQKKQTPVPEMKPEPLKIPETPVLQPQNPVPASVPAAFPSLPEQKVKPKTDDIDRESSEIWDRIIQWFWAGENSRNWHVSAEYALATTWLIRIGILILIAGMIFFLKYAIQNNLISPQVRIGGAFLAGCCMAVAGMYGARKKYRIAAVGILGAGFVTMYLSARAGYIVYSMTGTLTAYAIMTVITIAAMISAIRVDHPFPAFLGIAGGYLTPVMLSAGSRDSISFLIYLTIISVGFLVLSCFRRWRGLQIFSFLLYMELILFVIFFRLNPDVAGPLVLLLGINYGIFSLIPLTGFRKEKEFFTNIEVTLTVADHLLFTFAGLKVLALMPNFDRMQALMLFAMLLFQAGLAAVYFRMKERRGVCASVFFCVFSAVLMIPVQLSGEWIPAAWAILALVLCFVALFLRSRWLMGNGKGVFFLVFLRFCLYDLGKVPTEPPDFRSSFLLFGVLAFSLLAVGCGAALYGRRRPEDLERFPLLREIFLVSGGVLTFCYTSLEVHKFLCLVAPDFVRGGLSLWWGVLAFGLILGGILGRVRSLRISGLLIFGLCTLKVFFYDLNGYSLLAKSIGLLILSAIMIVGAILYIRFKDRFHVA